MEDHFGRHAAAGKSELGVAVVCGLVVSDSLHRLSQVGVARSIDRGEQNVFFAQLMITMVSVVRAFAVRFASVFRRADLIRMLL